MKKATLCLAAGLFAVAAAQAAVTLSGTVWIDANRNGVLDGGESSTGIPTGLHVNLVNTSGTVEATASVAAGGGWSISSATNDVSGFRLVLAGSATSAIAAALPAGWVLTGEDMAGSTDVANGAAQTVSVGSFPALDRLGTIILPTTASGQSVTSQDFGMIATPTCSQGYTPVLGWGRITGSTSTSGANSATMNTVTQNPHSIAFTSIGNSWTLTARADQAQDAWASDYVDGTAYNVWYLENNTTASTDVMNFILKPAIGPLHNLRFVMDDFDNSNGDGGAGTPREAAQVAGYSGGAVVTPMVTTTSQYIHLAHNGGFVDITTTSPVGINYLDAASMVTVYFTQPVDSVVIRQYHAAGTSTSGGIDVRQLEVCNPVNTDIASLCKPNSGSVVAISNVTNYQSRPDSINGHPATIGVNGNATIQTNGVWPTGVTLNTTTGAVSVASTAAAGTHNLSYLLSDTLTAPYGPNAITMPVTITVSNTCNSVGGNVFADVNGLSDNIVGGTGILGTDGGGTLRAVLWDATLGRVMQTTSVASNGTYSFTNVADGQQYRVYLTTGNPPVGSDATPTVTLPAGWASTGEYNGGTTAGATGNDGTHNGALDLGTLMAGITQANFGIERAPDSDPKSANIADPQQGNLVTLDGSGGNPPVFTGSDPDDQPASGSLSGKKVRITSLPTGGELWYNGTQIALGQDGVNLPSVSNPFVVANFTPVQLQWKATGSGYTTTSFTYAYTDAADVADPTPATYALSWSTPLSTTLMAFRADALDDCSVAVSWEASNETGLARYEVEQSLAGADFRTVASVEPQGGAPTTYRRIIRQDAPDGLYRLRMVERSGAQAFSRTTAVRLSCATPSGVRVFPNPTRDIVSIEGLSADASVAVYDAWGRRVRTATATATGLSLAELPTGIYQIVVNRTGQAPQRAAVVKQ